MTCPYRVGFLWDTVAIACVHYERGEGKQAQGSASGNNSDMVWTAISFITFLTTKSRPARGICLCVIS